MENENNESNNRKVMIGIIVTLLLVLCIALYFVFQGKKDNADLTTQKTELDAKFHSLSDSMDVRNSDIQQMVSKNAQLDSTLTNTQKTIENQKKQISGLLSKNKLTKTELAKAKSMIADYETSIGDLQKKVADLEAANQKLTQDNKQLSTDLTNEKQTTSQLSEQNKGLSQKVEVGSLLKLSNFEVVGVKKHNNGKETTTKNAKAVEALRISFETGENKVLSKGPLSLYVRVINPKGETISVADQGSGTFQSSDGGTSMQYTKKADIDYAQANKKVTIDWKQNVNTAGVYKVEVYQSGHMVGKGETKLN
jgi:myosin heavy subunit